MSSNQHIRIALRYVDVYLFLRGIDKPLEDSLADPDCNTLAKNITKRAWAEEFVRIFEVQIAKIKNDERRQAIRLRFGLDDGIIRTFKQIGEAIPTLAVLFGNKGKDKARYLVAKAGLFLRNPHRMSPLYSYIKDAQTTKQLSQHQEKATNITRRTKTRSPKRK